MKTTFFYCFCILGMVSITSCSEKIEGEVFSNKADGGNIGLGGITIYFWFFIKMDTFVMAWM
jgi:hypothetical protein